jgi:hypothetical protein
MGIFEVALFPNRKKAGRRTPKIFGLAANSQRDCLSIGRLLRTDAVLLTGAAPLRALAGRLPHLINYISLEGGYANFARDFTVGKLSPHNILDDGVLDRQFAWLGCSYCPIRRVPRWRTELSGQPCFANRYTVMQLRITAMSENIIEDFLLDRLQLLPWYPDSRSAQLSRHLRLCLLLD